MHKNKTLSNFELTFIKRLANFQFEPFCFLSFIVVHFIVAQITTINNMDSTEHNIDAADVTSEIQDKLKADKSLDSWIGDGINKQDAGTGSPRRSVGKRCARDKTKTSASRRLRRRSSSKSSRLGSHDRVMIGALTDSHIIGGYNGNNNSIFSGNAFPEPERRRGELPTLEPSSTNNWSIAKWKIQLDLEPFDPESEVQMEIWFEDASYKIRAHQATATTVVKVMQLLARPHLRLVLGAVLIDCDKFTYIEDIADAIAVRIFRGDAALEQYERDLFIVRPETTVFNAFATYQRTEETYNYMCERRGRYPALGPHQQIQKIFKLMPIHVSNQIRKIHLRRAWKPMELFSYGLEMEDTLERVDENVDPAEMMAAEDAIMRDDQLRCYACNGNHLRRNCPHRKDRCASCGIIGHISQACKAHVIRDTAGQRRMIATPKQSGITVETKLDNTTPQQLRSVAGVVEKFITQSDNTKERAKERYAAKKKAKDPRATVKQAAPRQILWVDEDDSKESVEENDDADHDNIEFGINEPSEVMMVDVVDIPIPKKRKLLEVSMKINGRPVMTVLDTAALMNCMSRRNAERLGIKVDPKTPKIAIKDVHQKIAYHSLSEKVEVYLNKNFRVKCRFAIFDNSVQTIVGLITLTNLNAKLDLPSKTIDSGGEIHNCYWSEEKTIAKEISTIQQNDNSDTRSVIQEMVAKWNSELSASESKEAQHLLEEFADLWQYPNTGRCTTVKMQIKVDGKPRRAKVRPTPIHLRDVLNKQVDDLLKAGVIVPMPDCKWVSPCQLVPKPRSDKWRLVIDYRYINALIEDDSYQIPNAQDLLIRLTDAKILSLVDLNWGFWNVSLEEDSWQYTGFVVPERGVFVWTVMPFGLKISPTIFQRSIEKALRNLLDKGKVSVYIDDIMIYTSTMIEHLKILKEVFIALREGGFYINLAKAHLFKQQLLYLGHIVGKGRLLPDPAKIQAIQQATPPKDKKTLLSFCAAANYLRMYIPNFSHLMIPLTSMTSKYVKFIWSNEQNEAFDKVKEAIVNACYLVMPNWSKPFVIFADASEAAVGAALAQEKDEGGGLNFVSFASKKLTETQRNWSPTERELYAIVWSCEHFERIIKGSRPLVYSDHAALEHLVNANSPKLKRWALRLSEFNPVIRRIDGERNSIADWLSRSVPEEEDQLPDYAYVPTIYHIVHDMSNDFELPTPEDMIEAAKVDEMNLPKGTLDWINGVAYGRQCKKLFIPSKYRLQLLLWFHTSRFGGHQGITRTVNRLHKMVWWPKLHQSVVDFINSCPICNAVKSIKSTSGEQGVLSKTKLFEMISMDFIGPRKYHARKYWIVVIIDHYSRFMTTVVVDKTAHPIPIIALRDHWVSKFGAPRIVLCDRGPEFTSESFKEYVTNILKSKLFHSSPEYPQGNGINESSHRILETAIKTHTFATHFTIEDAVADATLLYNTTPNSKIGDTPASLVFGCDLHLPGLEDFENDYHEEARLTNIRNYRGTALLLEQLKNVEESDVPLLKGKAQIDFKIGDIITYRLTKFEKTKTPHVSSENKYAPVRSFPHRVEKVTSKTLTVKSLWTRAKSRTVPKEQCKLISTFIPELMRAQAVALYPKANWIEKDIERIPIIDLEEDDSMEQSSLTEAPETESSPPPKRFKRRRSTMNN